jgi:hypothetical protein
MRRNVAMIELDAGPIPTGQDVRFGLRHSRTFRRIQDVSAVTPEVDITTTLAHVKNWR